MAAPAKLKSFDCMVDAMSDDMLLYLASMQRAISQPEYHYPFRNARRTVLEAFLGYAVRTDTARLFRAVVVGCVRLRRS